MAIIFGILDQGLIYGVLALGLYISYIIMNFPDLTVDGSFPLGAAVSVALLIRGFNPVLCLVIAFFAGFLAGAITGLIHVRLDIRDLLSGVIVMTGLYTINLFLAGQANVPIFDETSIFNNGLINEGVLSSDWGKVIVLLIIVAILKCLLDFYLTTRSGFLLRATGNNPSLVKTLAQDPGRCKILGLALANGLVSLSGAMLMQYQRYFEISMGTGTMVMGLASVIIGIKIFSPFKIKRTTKVILGSIIYQAIIALAIGLGLSATSMKLITALLLLLVLVLSRDEEGKYA